METLFFTLFSPTGPLGSNYITCETFFNDFGIDLEVIIQSFNFFSLRNGMGKNFAHRKSGENFPHPKFVGKFFPKFGGKKTLAFLDFRPILDYPKPKKRKDDECER